MKEKEQGIIKQIGTLAEAFAFAVKAGKVIPDTAVGTFNEMGLTFAFRNAVQMTYPDTRKDFGVTAVSIRVNTRYAARNPHSGVI